MNINHVYAEGAEFIHPMMVSYRDVVEIVKVMREVQMLFPYGALDREIAYLESALRYHKSRFGSI